MNLTIFFALNLMFFLLAIIFILLLLLKGGSSRKVKAKTRDDLKKIKEQIVSKEEPK